MWIKKSENLIKHTSVMIVMCSLKPHDLQFKTIQIVQERLALLWRENGKVFSPFRSACKSVSIMCLRCERSEETAMKVFFSNKTKAFLYSHRYQVLPINKRLLCYNQLWKYLLRWTLPHGVCGGPSFRAPMPYKKRFISLLIRKLRVRENPLKAGRISQFRVTR